MKASFDYSSGIQALQHAFLQIAKMPIVVQKYIFLSNDMRQMLLPLSPSGVPSGGIIISVYPALDIACAQMQAFEQFVKNKPPFGNPFSVDLSSAIQCVAVFTSW